MLIQPVDYFLLHTRASLDALRRLGPVSEQPRAGRHEVGLHPGAPSAWRAALSQPFGCKVWGTDEAAAV
jgi:hypothetical protein